MCIRDRARGEVTTVEITVAPADRRADGVSVHAGDAIALVLSLIHISEPTRPY